MDPISGCLIGTAVGDAVGLPAEGCSRSRVDRRFPRPWRHRLIGCWGMCSDDVYHTAPMVLFTALRYGGDPREALEQLWSCGGDVDSTGALLGALLGAHHGPEAFPSEWVLGIHNGPLSLAVLRRAAQALGAGQGRGPVSWCWPLQPLRNLVFLLIVLLHGLRRLLP